MSPAEVRVTGLIERLRGELIVSCQPVGPPAKPYFVHGVLRDVLMFPPDSVLAQPFLVIRVVIEWHGQRKNADVAVSVHK